MKIQFNRLNHIQICIPTSQEAVAKAFYCDILGLEEIEKPSYLRKNGGFWLRIADIELHIGAEDQVNTSKRHPAFEVNQLDTIKKMLQSNGVKTKEDRSLPTFNRFSFYDPFNNRIELLEKKSTEELAFLGKEVKVVIDRPINSMHPKYGYPYPINYGFIPNTIGGDGLEVDAYVIGETQPLTSYQGIVKAVIIRQDDMENKLVVAKSSYEVNKMMIARQTNFQEQYFDTYIRLME